MSEESLGKNKLESSPQATPAPSRTRTLLDDNDPILRGFCAALRNKEYFVFFNDVFTFMNKVQQELDPGPRTDTYFLDKIYKTKSLGKNWLKIVTLYERGYAPIHSTLLSGTGETTREQSDHEALCSRLKVLYPPPEGLDEDMKLFTDYFLTRPYSELKEDFKFARESLEVTCTRLGTFQSAKELAIHEKNPKEALLRREERLKSIKSLFASSSASFVCSASTQLKSLLAEPGRAERIPFHAGQSFNSIDAQIGGFHGAGLIVLMGGTSGFKTGAMSSIIANHCLESFKTDEKPPTIWGYIGEDGVEAYTRRIVTNIMNRPPFFDELDFGEYSIGEFNQLIVGDQRFQECVFGLIDEMLPNCHWIRSPEKPEEKLKFSIIDVLNAFDAKLASEQTRPRFIVVDYLNLLQLPSSESSGNRAQDLSKIAHIMDEWSQQKGIPIITAVQASVGGVKGARDMRFFEQEDIHECKSIEHHCRMMISLLPYTEYVDSGEPENPYTEQRWLAVKILKNRDGPRNLVFVMSLNEKCNITFVDSKHFPERDWEIHKERILAKKAEATGVEPEGASRQRAQGFGNQKRQGGGPGRSRQSEQGKGPVTADAVAGGPVNDSGAI